MSKYLSAALFLTAIACSPARAPGIGIAPPASAPAIRNEVNNGEGYEFVLSGEGTSTHSIVLPGSQDQVWRALRLAYAAMEIPTGLLDETNRTIGNQDLRARGRLGDQPLSTLLDCGRILGGPIASTYQIRLNVTSRVRPAPASSATIITHVSASASDPTSSSPGVRCTSTGEIEKRIAGLTALRLSESR